MALALQACGGGGGGGGGGSSGTSPVTPAEPARNVPLRLDAAAFYPDNAPLWGPYAIDRMMRVGLQAVVEVQAIARAGVLQMDRGCAHLTLVDADGNGRPSAGDMVKVDYNKCVVYYLDEDFTGTLTVRLTSVDDAAHGAVAGTVDFGAGLVPVQVSSSTWLGTLNFRRVTDLTQERLEVSATAADDLRSISGARQEFYQHPQFTRTSRRDTARTSLTGSMTLSSDRLGGRVEIAIDPALSGYLKTHFDTGSIRITGAANSRISFPASAKGAETIVAELDSNGDGLADATLPMKASMDLVGYLLGDAATPGVVAARDDTRLQLVYQPPFDGVDVDAPLRFQFDRPLRADTALQVVLIDHGGSLSAGTAEYSLSEIQNDWPVIAADVEVRGALLLVRPRETLRYGHAYQVLASNIGDFVSSQQVVFQAANSAAQTNVNVQWTGFATDNTMLAGITGAGLRSMVMSGKPVTISSTVPNALSLPLKYQWTQLSGPTLELTSPTQANTEAKLTGTAAPGVTKAVLQLAVTDTLGRQSVTPVEVQVGNLVGLTTALYFVSASDSAVGAGQTRIFSSLTGAWAVYVFPGSGLDARYQDGGPNKTSWSLSVADADGGVPAVGTYANAVGSASTAKAPRMTLGGGCDSIGNFTVLERSIDNANNIQRLAIDFDYRCVTGTSQHGPVRGSLRFNSNLPIPP